MRLSIIVPIYNTENYILNTLNTLLNQNYKNIEILLIDDGSTDNSYKICENFCKNNHQFKLFHKENGGVSSARNFGLDVCSGDYIAFVDSDDFVQPLMFEKLMLEAEKCNYDFVQCDFVNDSHFKSELCSKITNQEIIGGLESSKLLFKPNKMIFNSVSAKIFKRDLIEKIRFDSSIRIGEDLLFSFMCCIKAKKIKLIDYQGYAYVYREESAMNSSFSEKKYDGFKVNDIIFEYVKNDIDYIRILNRRNVEIAFDCYCSACESNEINDHRKFLINKIKNSKNRYSLNMKYEIYVFLILHFSKLFELFARIWCKISR